MYTLCFSLQIHWFITILGDRKPVFSFCDPPQYHNTHFRFNIPVFSEGYGLRKEVQLWGITAEDKAEI